MPQPEPGAERAPSGRRRTVILGPPASGKGTQGRRLAAHLGVPHVSTGQLLRRSIDSGDPHQIAQMVAEGRRVADEVVEAVVKPALEDGFVLDGYPRTAHQAERLDHLLGDRVDAAIELSLDDEILTVRMALRAEEERRSDDTPEVFFRRLEDYRREEPEIRRYYDRRLITVDSTGDEDEVFSRLVDALSAESVRR
ncbi:MAG: adenylate kinase family protein [Actinomycetota bacterium]